MNSEKFEQKERLKMSSRMLSLEELKEIVIDGGRVKDPRFHRTDHGGVFHYFRPQDLSEWFSLVPLDKVFPVVEAEGKIVGLGELEQDPNRPKNKWIKHVSVDPEYRGRGVGRELLEVIFKYAKENGFTLEESIYSDEGKQKLAKIVTEYAGKYGVEMVK